MDLMRCVEVIVKGKVQRVGFRYFVSKAAKELGIRGFVKNMSDGSVYILATAEEFAIDKFLSLLPTYKNAVVKKIEVREIQDIQTFEKFEVR